MIIVIMMVIMINGHNILVAIKIMTMLDNANEQNFYCYEFARKVAVWHGSSSSDL